MNVESVITGRYAKLGPRVVQALQRRYFEAYYCENRELALQKAIELIPKDHVVAWGGSETLKQIGLLHHIRHNGYTYIDRRDGKTPAEQTELMRKSLLCDTYLLSSNAISEDGQLVNIDGTGNRVAAMIYGPRSVIVVAGMNKVTKTLEDAWSRARNIASPLNMQRFAGVNFPENCTPCAVTGSCGDCITPDYCICSYLVTTRICRPAGKIKVILVGEDLGF